jgi:hypothetical protein
MTNGEGRAALQALIGQWRAMAKAAFEEGPIPHDEAGHVARWTAVELCADELQALIAESPRLQPQEKTEDTEARSRPSTQSEPEALASETLVDPTFSRTGNEETDGKLCEHAGCDLYGIGCWLPDDHDEPTEWLCPEHAHDAGYCRHCGIFWAGIDDCLFARTGLCDNCRSLEEWFDANAEDDDELYEDGP